MAIGAVFAISRVTLSEIIRDKVLYNAAIICFLLFSVGILVSKVSFIRPDRIVLNFGLTALAVSNGMLAVFGGATLLAREFQSRTIFIALTKPISRFQFLLGKFLGLSLVLLLNSALLSLGYLLVLYFLSTSGSTIQSTLYWALELLALQSLVLSGIAVFFSSFSTVSLSVMMTIGFYLMGVNVSQIRLVAVKTQSPFSRGVLEIISYFLPNFEHFNLGFKVTYGIPVSGAFLFGSQVYALIWIMILLMAAGILIEKKEG